MNHFVDIQKNHLQRFLSIYLCLVGVHLAQPLGQWVSGWLTGSATILAWADRAAADQEQFCFLSSVGQFKLEMFCSLSDNAVAKQKYKGLLYR